MWLRVKTIEEADNVLLLRFHNVAAGNLLGYTTGQFEVVIDQNLYEDYKIDMIINHTHMSSASISI